MKYKLLYEEEKRKREELERKFKEAMQKLEELKKQWNVEEYQKTIAELKDEVAKLKRKVSAQEKTIEELEDAEEVVGLLRTALSKIMPQPIGAESAPTQAPGEVKIQVKQPILTVEVRRKVITLSDEDLEGRIAILYASGELPSDKWFTVRHVYDLFRSHGWSVDPRTSKMLDKFCEWGFLKKHYAGKRPEYRLRLRPEEAERKGLIKMEEKSVE